MQALIVAPEQAAGVRFVADHPVPKPRRGEALVRVLMAGICATDLEICRGYMKFTGVPGHEFVGVVETGPGELIGRRVVAEINCPCGGCELCRRGLGNHCRRRTVLGIAGRDGAFAEYLTVPASNCHPVPEALSDRQAVFVEPLAAAAHVLDELPAAAHGSGEGAGSSRPRVAVLGSGRLGLLVAQVLAGHPCELTVVGRNPLTLNLCRRWGICDLTCADLTPTPEYDVVVECTGVPDGLRLALQLCRPRGLIVLKSTYADPATLDLAPVVVNEVRIVGNRCGRFERALELLARGAVRVEELISAVYPLSRGPEAVMCAAQPQNVKVLIEPGRP